MARISPTRGQKLIFILYILLGVGILYLDITSNSFQSVKNGFKSFKISSSYFLNQITIELYDESNGGFYTSKTDHFFEFELTMLNNPVLL